VIWCTWCSAQSWLIKVVLQSRNVHIWLKIAIRKFRTHTNMALKQLGKNDYQNAIVWDIRKGKQSSLKPSVGCTTCSPAFGPATTASSSAHRSCANPILVSGKGTISSLFSPSLARGPSLNLKLFHIFYILILIIF